MIDIDIQNVENFPLDNQLFFDAAKKAYQAVAKEPCECTIRVVGHDEGRELNRQYRDKDKPTNVLSFSYEDDDPDAELEYIGDIVLCYPVVESESLEQGKSIEQHLFHLIVHGTLHLCGYDHEESEEAEQMEQLEIQILDKLGIQNPYLRD